MEFSQWWWLAAAATVAISLLSFTFFIGRWVGRINQKVDDVNENLNTTNTTLNSFMKEVRNDIKTILGRLPPPTLGHNSPLRLTDLGREVSRELEATAWAQHLVVALQGELSGKPDYEVHEFCFDYVRDYQPAPEMDSQIKACAYEHGIDREAVLNVLAIELRDALLVKLESDRDPH